MDLSKAMRKYFKKQQDLLGILNGHSEETITGYKTVIAYSQEKEAMDKFKMESASEVGVNLKQGYNGDITARQAGSIGGQMVKKMIQAYENNIQ